VDVLAAGNSIGVSRKENQSFVGLGTVQGKRVGLAQPRTYMNLSGSAVKGLLERYEVGPEQLILVYDELALPWQSIRIRKAGSSAGHNGVKSVIASLGTDEFVRVRLGIQPVVEQAVVGRPGFNAAKYVLAPFRRAQQQEVEEFVARGGAAVESIIADGVEKSMTIFNGN
jgi:PTH1 family peptidyl-tRNA hydrolase